MRAQWWVNALVVVVRRNESVYFHEHFYIAGSTFGALKGDLDLKNLSVAQTPTIKLFLSHFRTPAWVFKRKKGARVKGAQISFQQ